MSTIAEVFFWIFVSIFVTLLLATVAFCRYRVTMLPPDVNVHGFVSINLVPLARPEPAITHPSTSRSYEFPMTHHYDIPALVITDDQSS